MDGIELNRPLITLKPEELEHRELCALVHHLVEVDSAKTLIDNEFTDRLEALTKTWSAEHVDQLKQLVDDWSTIKNRTILASATQIRVITGDDLLPGEAIQ
jgi:hypothetical protein